MENSYVKEKGFAHLAVVLIIGVGILLAVLFALGAANIPKVLFDKRPSGLYLDVDKDVIKRGETAKATITYINKSGKSQQLMFSSTCVGPYIKTEKSLLGDVGGICGQAITFVSTKRFDKRTWSFSLNSNDLYEGENKLQATWSNLNSPEIIVTRERTKEGAINTKRCTAKSVDFDKKEYCEKLIVTFKKGTTTIAEGYEHLKKLGLSPSHAYGYSQESFSVYVPPDEESEWKTRIKTEIPNVESVR